MNLHHLVRNAIPSVHPDETITLYASSGQVNDRGRVTPIYAAPVRVKAQIQSESDSTLNHAGRMSLNTETKKAWFYGTPGQFPAGIVRPLSKNGDMVKREDGTWWLVTGVLEDFSSVGWVSVRLVLQVKEPDFSASAWFTETNGAGHA